MQEEPYRLEPPDDWYRLDMERFGALQVRDLCDLIPIPPPSDPEDQDDHEAR
jgi:hypothetical protein